MIRALYNWTMSLAEHPRAVFALAAIAFIEASVFPIPPDVLLIPMIIAAPQRAWLFAMVATVSSVLGGLAGYMIGAFCGGTSERNPSSTLAQQMQWPRSPPVLTKQDFGPF